LSFTLHPGAASDLAQAARFCRQEGGRALAARFIDEFERVAALLAANPALGMTTEEERRWFPLHGFPYSVIYCPQRQGIHILVLRHQHRNPEHGAARR
jgi:plasmid stabilization system protein ParE